MWPSGVLHKGTATVTNAALLLFGVLIVEYCRLGVNEYHHFTFGMSEDIFAQLMLYLGAISLVERCPTNRWTLRIILTIALLARLVCVFAPPFLSTDVYRYVWDGKVQAHGINPFRYIPADSHLQSLRDPDVYPKINRRDSAPTIYPPGAQAIFLAVTRISATVPFMKLAMVGFEAGTCLVLMRLLKALNLPRERIVLYAWHPLCFWEIASSGHVDAAALLFISLALLSHLREKRGAAGAWLGAATLVKLYPAALLPAFLGNLKGQRLEWRMPAVLVSMVAAGYLCYSSVGLAVFGYLPGYAQEEGLESGGRFFPLTFLNRSLHWSIPPVAYIVFCAVLGMFMCVWAWRRGAYPGAAIFTSLVFATVLNLCYSPHYPWYFLWLLPSVTIFPWRPAFYLVAASTFLFATRLGAPGEPMYLLNIFLYAGFFIVLGYDLFLDRIAVRFPGIPYTGSKPETHFHEFQDAQLLIDARKS